MAEIEFQFHVLGELAFQKPEVWGKKKLSSI